MPPLLCQRFDPGTNKFKKRQWQNTSAFLSSKTLKFAIWIESVEMQNIGGYGTEKEEEYV